MAKEKVMPESMKAKALNLFNQKQIAELRLQTFLEGCMEGLGLQGNWNLDLATWTFKEMQPAEDKEGS